MKTLVAVKMNSFEAVRLYSAKHPEVRLTAKIVAEKFLLPKTREATLEERTKANKAACSILSDSADMGAFIRDYRDKRVCYLFNPDWDCASNSIRTGSLTDNFFQKMKKTQAKRLPRRLSDRDNMKLVAIHHLVIRRPTYTRVIGNGVGAVVVK